ncbi:leucine-rich repeat-containing protein 47-like [Topomyia yanbarensis]|uniref:leucine-rich repeat-containing protein 47-like n=1 Tax=Topomyia yanbarensis TaxID=2498891 RepID=UPI00273CE176|nr:leucine-rich repeat-containing protein 47-like [Topomyia yanbarensis]XP_058834229.1 leucine-rich repeat-containing protein 47-like [Topomyia yanbarensis]
MWPEIQTAKDENRRELKLSGAVVRDRFEADDGRLDETIYQLTTLNLLDINDTPLGEISPKIGELKNLQSLLLFRNKISTIPAELGQLSSLKVLDLSGNQIESLPVELGQLKLLTTVNFSGNKLTRVDLSQFEYLNVCNLAANQLEEFPMLYCGKDVHYLSELNLEKNRIKEIPASLTKQAGLKNLNVAENKIELVPQLLVKCPKLKEINLKDNPLKDKRLKKLVDQCRSKQVLDYVEKNGHIIAEHNESSVADNRDSANNELELPVPVEHRQKVTIIIPANEARKVFISQEAKSIRPYVLNCIVRNYTISSMKKFLQLQNELHDNECGKRELATIATHDLAKVKGDVRCQADLSEQIQITPLGAKAKVTAAKYYDDLKQQAEIIRKEKKRSTYSGVHKFINLLEGKVFVFFADEEKVISLPPLTNCDETKISPETKDMLLEVTSSVSLECCHKVMVELLKKMLLMDVQVTRSRTEGKKKVKGKGTTVVTYDRSIEMIVEQVRLHCDDGTFHSVFPGKGDLAYPEEEKIDIEFK